MGIFDKAKEAFDDIKDKVTGEDDADDRVKDAARDAGDTVTDAGRDAGDALGDAGDRAGDALKDAGDRAGDALEDAGDAAARGIDNTGDWADRTTGGRFSEGIDSVENTTEGWVDQDGSAGTRER